MPIEIVRPVEVVPVDSAVRAMCFPHAHDAVTVGAEQQSHGGHRQSAAFDVWCASKTGAIVIRDARDPEVGGNPEARAAASPVSHWDGLQTISFHNSFARVFAAVHLPDGHVHVWVGFSDGPVRIFAAEPPYKLVDTINFQSNLVSCNAIAASVPGSTAQPLVCVAFNNTVVCFDGATRAPMQNIGGKHGTVRALAVVGEGFVVIGADDGALAMWDVIYGVEVCRSTGAHVRPISAIHADSISADDVAVIAATHKLLKNATNVTAWAMVWAGCENGTVSVWILPAAWDGDEPAGLRRLMRHPVHLIHRKDSISSIQRAPRGAPVMLVATAGHTSVSRYDRTTFKPLPALAPVVADHAGHLLAAYAASPVSSSTLATVWSLDASGRFTPLVLERAGTLSAAATQHNNAALRRATMEAEYARIAADLKAHRELLHAITSPHADEDMERMAAEATTIKRRRTHMRDAAACALGRLSCLTLMGIAYRRWRVKWTHGRHNYKRNLAMRALQAIAHAGAHAAYKQWQWGAAIAAVRRTKLTAAGRLMATNNRLLSSTYFTQWARYRAQRNAEKRLIHLLTRNGNGLRRECFEHWQHVRYVMKERRARSAIADLLTRQLATGLRTVYFHKWQRFLRATELKAEKRRNLQNCMAAMCSTNDRQVLRMRFMKWGDLPRIRKEQRAKVNAAHLLVAGSETLRRAHEFQRWRAWARRAKQLRAVSGANSSLARLTESGMRRAYYNKWKCSVTLRKAKEKQAGSLQSALWFLSSRQSKASMMLAWNAWAAFRKERLREKRQRETVETFLRHTRMGAVIVAFRRWFAFYEHKQKLREKQRTFSLLSRTSTNGLRREYFITWRSYKEFKKQARHREAVMSTFGRNSSLFVLRTYYRRWASYLALTRQFKEMAHFSSTTGTKRLGQLRTIYFGKWLGWLAGRAVAKRRDVEYRRDTRLEAKAQLEHATAGLKTRMSERRGDMATLIVEIEKEKARADQAIDGAVAREARNVELEAKLSDLRAEVEEASATVERYVFTLKNPSRVPALSLAADWRDRWLNLETNVGDLRRVAARDPVSFGAYHKFMKDVRSDIMSMRNAISRDVAEHLTLKRDPPPPSPSRLGSPSAAMRSDSPGARRPPSPVRRVLSPASARSGGAASTPSTRSLLAAHRKPQGATSTSTRAARPALSARAARNGPDA